MKASNAASASFLVSAIQISWSARLAFDCWLLGSLFKTLAVLCTQQRWPRVLGQTSPTACQKARAPPRLLSHCTRSGAAVGARELGSHRKPPPFEVEEELFPRLRALAHAVDESDKFLFAFGRGADDHQQALRGLLEPGLHMDAVDPEVNVAVGREITLAPTRMLVRPGLLEPPDGRGREPAGILAEQCDQRLLEITGGDALQVENRDQHL